VAKYRLTFKPEFHDAILAGSKTGTLRFGGRKPFKDGDVVAFVGHFLDPFNKAFAYARIKKKSVLWRDVTDEMLTQTTVTRDWYTSRYPTLHDFTIGEFITWEFVSEEIARG